MYWEDYREILIIFATLAVVIGGLVTLVALGERKSCAIVADQMGVPHQWGFWTDCMIQVNGRWIPLDSFRVQRGETA